MKDRITQLISEKPLLAIALPIGLALSLLIVANLFTANPAAKPTSAPEKFVQQVGVVVEQGVEKAKGPVETAFRGAGWVVDKTVDVIGKLNSDPNGKDITQ